MTTLHITNGDHAADTIKATGIGGDVQPWRDPMHHGPFPADLDLDAVSIVRARYLGPPANGQNATQSFQLRNDTLRAATRYDEVILWFEHDLLDQLQILQVLDWFADNPPGKTALSMICIDRFPGIVPFRGLGQLTPEQMASLPPSRQPVTNPQLATAKSGWSAFRSSDPTILETFLRTDLTPLPFLHAALARHLEEYPWSNDGLTRTERQILKLVSQGTTPPGRVFAANMELETALFVGDLRTFDCIATLCGASQPLLESTPYGTFRPPSDRTLSWEEFLAQRLALTDTGTQVLSGQRDATDLIQRDDYLGGVHLLTGPTMWTWDAATSKLRSGGA